MALNVNDTTPRAQYTASAAQDTFAYTFEIYAESDLKVYLTPVGSTPNDTNDLLTLTTDYTVTGEGVENGGNVVLVTPATAGDVITIIRDIPISRTSQYQTLGDLSSVSFNEDLNKLVMMVSQQEYALASRIMKFIETADLTGVNISIPAPVASKLFRWNAAADALELVDIANLGAVTLQDIVSKTGDTGSAVMPPGTTAQRDTVPVNGYMRYNSDYARFEGYAGGAWAGLGGASGAGGDSIFYENGQTVNNDYTITANQNAVSAGPITIADGVTVSIPDGSTWAVV